MKQNASIQKRILTLNMTVSLILLGVFSLSFFLLNWKTSQENRAAADSTLKVAVQTVEGESIRLKALTEMCSTDRSFLFTAANRLGIEEFVNVSIEASSKLSLIRYSLPYASNVFLYVKNNQQVIQQKNAVMHKALFLPSLQKKLRPGEVLPDFDTAPDGFYSYENFLLYKQSVQNFGCLMIEINPEQFCSLGEMAAALQCEFVILDQGGNVFLSTSRDVSAALGRLPDDPGGSTVRVNGVKYQVNQHVLEHTGLRFLMFSQNGFETSQRRLLALGICACLIMAFICFMSIRLNQKIYSPLRDLSRKIGGRQENRSEIEAIAGRLKELTDEKLRLNEQLYLQTSIQENLFLSYAFSTQKTLDEELCGFLRQRYSCYRIAIIAAQDSSGSCAGFFERANSYLADTLEARAVRTGDFCCAYLIPEMPEENGKSADPAGILKEYLSVSIQPGMLAFAGVSGPSEEVASIPLMLQEARGRMLSCPLPGACGFAVRDTGGSFGEPLTIPLEVQNTIARSILSGEEPEPLFRRFLFLSPEQPLGDFCSLYSVLRTLLSTLVPSGADSRDPDWKTRQNPTAYHPGFMLHCLSEDAKRLCDMAGGGQIALRYEVVQYIRHHFREPLSLESIAGAFQITPVYLSSWFKKNVGINLSLYLSNCRMEEAVRILQENRSIKVAELAEQVGISNVSTFLRQFKNYTGTTPDAYKRIHTE